MEALPFAQNAETSGRGQEGRRTERTGRHIFGSFIDALEWNQTLARLAHWASRRESRYVCICNVHSVVTAAADPSLMQAINGADMATPDGMPVAWMLRALGFPGQARINGPDLMWRYCALAEELGLSIYLLGGTDETLVRLQESLLRAFPRLLVAGTHSPPFRPLTDGEVEEVVSRINQSNASTVFVGLGCPKQESWMAAHRGRVAAVMVGVGAAFDYHAGTLRRAPLWMQKSGLEWLFRLVMEPRRLWRRYLVTNTLFVIKATRQLMSPSR